jgi:ATP/ADP translocase
MVRLLCLITGAREEELKQVLCSFTALMFLMLSYYLIKPLRNSHFLKEFDPRYMPLFYLLIPFLSFLVTKCFNYFCERMDKYKLIIRVYLLIMACKVAFTWVLMFGGKPATIIFYLWGSVYFLLAMSTLWSCFNDTFRPEQGMRFFGFVAMGATVGNIIGAKLSDLIADIDMIRPYATLVSAGAMALTLGFLLEATRYRRSEVAESGAPIGFESQGDGAKSRNFLSDVLDLLGLKYVRSIAVMVACLACFTTSLDFLSNQQIDRQMSKLQYHDTFADLEQATGETGYQFIYGLKSLRGAAVDQAIADFESRHHFTGVGPRYKHYKEELEAKTRKLFSRVFLYQGIVGVVMLTLVARMVFLYLGLRIAVLILPVFALVALAAFTQPLELQIVEFILVASGSLNYALNNATKEILYTVTSEETKFKHKPLIEGPGMRLGDVTASLLKLAIGGAVGAVGWSVAAGDRIFLGVTFVLVLIWLQAIAYAGRWYDKRRKGDELD